MFLVLYRTNLDDLPAGLFATREEADKYVASLSLETPDFLLDVMRVDRAGTCSVAIVEFADSMPVKMEVVRFFDDERELLEATA